MKNKYLIITAFLLLVSFIHIDKGAAQTISKLSVGDIPPPIKYSKWIKGDQFETFDPQHVYVIEFWATWCGPCKAAMPHLTELQKQYQGKVTFVGVNVWEKIQKDESYESVIPAVEKFVKANDANMGYTIIVDDKEQNMGNKWLRAAGQNGIPASFIIKDNRIVWLGHPGGLDSIIPKVLDGSFDSKAFKIEADKAAQREREFMEARMALLNPIKEALLAKDFEKAFVLMDKLVADKPDFKKVMDLTKFKTLLTEIDEKKAIEFAQKTVIENQLSPALILAEIYKVDGLSNDTYLWAANNFDDLEKITNPLVADAVATCYAKASQFEKAIKSQMKAIEIAEKALKEGAMVGTVTKDALDEYKNKLEVYKQGKSK